MAEYVTNDVQAVPTAQAIMFEDEVIAGGRSIYHRPGSGIITLRGLTCNQPFARFRCTFGANIALPTGGTAGPISVALALSGEANTATTMEVTPAAVEEFFNVSRTVNVNIPAGCCSQLSVENISGVPIDVRNASIVIERIA